MIRDAAAVAPGTTIERDVCVVGAGPAGIAIALDLERRGVSVCLVESGGDVPEAATQALYRGGAPSGGLVGSPDYLSASRLRFLGGTSNHWTGSCAPLDAIDCEARDWVPHSGWPITREALDPWYRRAAEWLEIRAFDYAPSQLAAPLPPLGTPEVETALYHRSPPTRFGPRFRPRLSAASRALLLLHANAVQVLAEGARVTGVEVAVLGGGRFRVRAPQTVLAAGALENARLLLASRPQAAPRGLGNAHDRVGRFFMDHFYGTAVAQVLFLRPARELAPYLRSTPDPGLGATLQAVLRLSDAVQRREKLLNTQFRLTLLRAAPTGLLADLERLTRDLADPARASGRCVALVEMGTEIAPDPANRVQLSSERDALGLPRLALHAAAGARDRESLVRAVDVFARLLGGDLSARVRVALDARDGFAALRPGAHHIGTTRMDEDPRHGVVDAQCRVHGVAGLYVAGSSVFPTSGRPNPTYTLLALALRLADHLAESREHAS